MKIIQNHINQTNHSSDKNLNHDFNKINKMNRICITSLRGTKQSRVKINEITNFSGLPRRSYLTARNDDVPFSPHVSRFTSLRGTKQSRFHLTYPLQRRGRTRFGNAVQRFSCVSSPLSFGEGGGRGENHSSDKRVIK